MARVAFVVRGGWQDAAALAQEAAGWLLADGHEVSLPAGAPAPPAAGAPAPPAGGAPAPPAAGAGSSRGCGDLDGVDLVVSLGGDGTMLRAAALVHGSGTPVLGVNLGHLGYLTVVEPAGLRHALDQFLSGEYAIHERMTLDVSVERGGSSEAREAVRATALNEALVEKQASGHTIRLALGIGGRQFITYAADGLMVATPTGSTAYNLSSRGPIASPRLRAMIVTPVSPHMLFDRSLVLDPTEEVRVELVDGRAADLVVDGQAVTVLAPGDAVVCCASPQPVRLVDFGAHDFHAILRAKFGLADRSER